MSNTEFREHPNPDSWLRSSLQLLRQIQETTMVLMTLAEKGDWKEFRKLTRERQQHFDNLKMNFELLEDHFATVDWPEQSPNLLSLRTEIQEQLKKVAKVNSEVFDIIYRKRQEIAQDIATYSKGQAFLKQYQSQLNCQKTISKLY